MGEKKRYKFSLRLKLVLLTTVLAIVTYTASAVCIYFIYPYLEHLVSEQIFMVATLLMGIIWSGILAYFAALFITKPLQKLEQVAMKAANGNIREDVPVSKSDDEIRSLSLAFNQMLHNLRDMVQNIEANFDNTNQKVIEITKASSLASEQSNNIYRTITEISKGADSSAVSIQETAESVEDVIKIAEDVQSNAKISENLSVEMVASLNESKEVVHSLITGINKLVDNNKTSLEAVNRLEENAKEVEKIISLVGDIAGQTNLLALNASIEAARAGEHGKGFAVVAEEVRKLADASSKAVQGISELIKNIQQEVSNVVVQISEQVAVANEEAKKGTKTNEAIAEMTTSVHEVADAVKQIAVLVEKQMESIQETSRQSQEVAAIAEETSAGAQEVNASTQQQTSVIQEVDQLAQELAKQAGQLKKMIDRFTV
ncbi:methyl-accepting chemotaxis protein [Fredinandcohnia sp. 179-A 10B2 NHS]|uniref:methyl-accepting chemotaxis protein n=1 Tax=Fredinandcohnia sp. 179-A 10B2 NHS TaxID=3235176 RepID=UPI0039A18A84